MGMYTEIFFRAKVTQEVVPFLNRWINSGAYDYYTNEPVDAPDAGHEFFKCARWMSLAGTNDSYFPMSNGPEFRKAYPAMDWDDWVLSLHTCIKNYDSEYEKFFDWIAPYIDEAEGVFIGYTLYEDVAPFTAPKLYYSSGVGSQW